MISSDVARFGGGMRALVAAACCSAAGAQDPTQYIEQQVRAGNIPGLSVAAVRGDDLLWHGGFGSAWPERGGGANDATADTAFTFASISKTVTGVAVMILKERGLVDLSADINTYLPYSVAVSGITLAQLMTHTSSITDNHYFSIPESDLYVDGDPTMSLHDFCAAMFTSGGRWYSSRTFSGSPGQRFDYSNVGSALAASVVEEVVKAHGVAAGYNEFVKADIFAPLGAAHGSHYLRDFAHNMEPPVGARPSEYWRNSYESWEHYSVPDYPNGFWRSSAETYARLLGMVANHGEWKGTRVLSRDSTDFIRERQGVDGNRQGGAFFYYKGDLLGHNGAELGIATEANFDPATGVGVVVLSNGDYCQGREFEAALDNIEAHVLQLFGAGGAARGGNATALAVGRDAARRRGNCHGHRQRHPHDTKR